MKNIKAFTIKILFLITIFLSITGISNAQVLNSTLFENHWTFDPDGNMLIDEGILPIVENHPYLNVRIGSTPIRFNSDYINEIRSYKPIGHYIGTSVFEDMSGVERNVIYDENGNITFTSNIDSHTIHEETETTILDKNYIGFFSFEKEAQELTRNLTLIDGKVVLGEQPLTLEELPTQELEVYGNVLIGNFPGAENLIPDSNGNIKLNSEGPSSNSFYQGDYIFQTFDPSERFKVNMFIDGSNTNIGIGTENATHKLTVDGNIFLSGNLKTTETDREKSYRFIYDGEYSTHARFEYDISERRPVSFLGGTTYAKSAIQVGGNTSMYEDSEITINGNMDAALNIDGKLLFGYDAASSLYGNEWIQNSYGSGGSHEGDIHGIDMFVNNELGAYFLNNGKACIGGGC